MVLAEVVSVGTARLDTNPEHPLKTFPWLRCGIPAAASGTGE
jgi:hypothetical protein